MAATKRHIIQFLDKLEGPIRASFLSDVLNIRSRAQIAALESAIAANNFDAVIRAIGSRPGSFNGVTDKIKSSYVESGVFTIGADVPKDYKAIFNWTNPRAEEWLRNRSSEFVKLRNGELIENVQAALQNGMARGINPRTTALDIVGRISAQTGRRHGGIVGLTRPQAEYVKKAREQLENLDNNYFSRKLRDRRYDSMVQKAIDSKTPLTKKQVNAIAGRYEDRMLKHRADMIARTESLAALNEASDESLRQVIDEGLAPKEAVKRIWRHSFGPNERPGHLKMSGQERGVDEPFSNPDTGAILMHPGDGPATEVVACRCFVEHKIDFVAVELAS